MANPDYIPHMAKLNEGLVSCVPTFIQVAAAEAIKSQDCVKDMLEHYTRRRDILADGLNAIPGFKAVKPKGSFYMFVNIKAFGKSSQEFAEELIRGAQGICVPGTAFGDCGEGFLRISYAYSLDHLKTAMERLKRFVEKLRKEQGRG
jgi:aminotransferase